MKKKYDGRIEVPAAEAATEAAAENTATAEEPVEATAAEIHEAAGSTEEDASRVETPKGTKMPEEAKEETGNMMYVGPTIQNLIRYGTVFANGVLTEKMNAVVAEFPAAAKLFVPVEKIPDAMKSLHEKNSALAAISDRMVHKYNKR